MSKLLSNAHWCEFYISNIIDSINIAKSSDFGKLKSGKTVFVGRQETNNGIQGFVHILPNEKKNCITISMVATHMMAFWQNFDFATSQNILVLRNKKFNKYSAYFICSVLNNYLLKKYGYGNVVKLSTFPKEKIMLPANSEGEPDYKFMEEYIKEREDKLKKQYKEHVKSLVDGLHKKVSSDKEWREFFISEIFNNIQRGKRLIKEHQKEGTIPYISSTALNNGVDNFISNEAGVRKYNNCLSLANSGSVGACFYEPFEFIASDHITHLKGNYSKYSYLFMSCMLNRLSEKYNFNREINDTRIKREKVFLPVNSKGEPDYEFMEDYMRYLEQKKILEYLEYIK